jgi:hypothetical protein
MREGDQTVTTVNRIVGRMEIYLGAPLSVNERERATRMAALMAVPEDDPSWAVVLAMWASQAEARAILEAASKTIRADMEAWLEEARKAGAELGETERGSATTCGRRPRRRQ